MPPSMNVLDRDNSLLNVLHRGVQTLIQETVDRELYIFHALDEWKLSSNNGNSFAPFGSSNMIKISFVLGQLDYPSCFLNGSKSRISRRFNETPWPSNQKRVHQVSLLSIRCLKRQIMTKRGNELYPAK